VSVQSKSMVAPDVHNKEEASSCRNIARTAHPYKRCSRRAVALLVFLVLGLIQFLVVYRKVLFTQVCLSFFLFRALQTPCCQNGSLGVACRCFPERPDDGDGLFDCYPRNESRCI